MTKVVFVEPETPGNIGALARAMNNFDAGEMILINPKCEVECSETRARAKHAYDTVRNARILNEFKDVEDDFDFLIGSTGLTPDNYSWERSTVTSEELRENVSRAEGEIALVLGREGKGLNNEELKMCDVVVNIPTSDEYPVMNITHAAAIILYEIHRGKEGKTRGKQRGKERETLLNYFNETIDNLDNIKKPEEVKNIFKRVINKSFIKPKESYALISAFKGIKNKLKEK